MEKTDLSWDQVKSLIKLRTIDGAKHFEATYSFRHPPESVFSVENSNYQLALTSATKSVKRLLKNKNDGIKILKKMQQKCIDSGAYRILDSKEKDYYITRPHNFIRSFLISNEKSQSSPVRQVLNASAYNFKAETSLNASLHSVPCRIADMPTLLFSLRL